MRRLNDRDDEDTNSLDKERAKEIAAAEKLGLLDFVFAGAIAFGVWFFQTYWAYPAMSPSIWADAAVASGARPASTIVPGLWTAIASQVYSIFTVAHANKILALMGHVTLAIITVFVYSFLREALTFVMRARPQRSPRRKLVMRIAAAIGAVSFAASDPVWAAGQFFCETTILLALTVAAIEFFFAFLRKGLLRYSYICAALLGLLIADSPAGIAITLLFIALNFFVIKVLPNLESPFFKPALIEVGKWHMTFFLMFAILLGVGINCVTFIKCGGLIPGGLSVGDLPLKYAQNYVSGATGAASLAGWILLLGFAIGPFVVSIVRFSVAADEESFLSYSTGIVFLFCGILAFSQCASIPQLWFWTHVDINSGYLLSLCSLMCVLTVACSVTILGVDGLCRDHNKLAKKYFSVAEDEDDGTDEHVMSLTVAEILRKLGVVIVPLMLIAAVIPGRKKEKTRQMLALVGDTVRATVEEAEDRMILFSDGKLDNAIEIESLARGKKLYCYSLFALEPNAEYLRTRGLDPKNREDYDSFKFDSAMGLRTWIHDKPANLTNVAVQVGFDLWIRDGKPLPPVGGMLSLPTSKDEEKRLAAERRAKDFEDRAIVLASSSYGDCTDKSLKDAFCNVMWRLGRMCLYRSDWYANQGLVDISLANREKYRKLEKLNAKYQEALREVVRRRMDQMKARPTPREILHLALVRADFEVGSEFARMILEGDPDDPDANWCMAMYYQRQGKLALCETYLKQCLIRNDQPAAIYNNLAMVQIEQGKFDAAEVNVKHALELIPDSAAVLETKRQLEDARIAKEEALKSGEGAKVQQKEKKN